MKKHKSIFSAALADAMPIILAYFPIAMTFGVVATANAMPPWLTIFISICVYAGGAQFMMIPLIISGVTPLSVIITVMLVNLRHFLYGTTLGPRFSLWPEWKKWIASFGLTDEVFAVTSSKDHVEPITPSYQFLFVFSCYASWVAGTIVGVLVDRAVPTSLSGILSYALPALFIALLFIGKRTMPYLVAAAFGALCALAATWLHMGSMGIIAGTLIGATVGAVINQLWISSIHRVNHT